MIEAYKKPIEKIILYYEDGSILQLTDEAAATWQRLQNSLLHMATAMQEANDSIEPVVLDWEMIRDKY